MNLSCLKHLLTWTTVGLICIIINSASYASLRSLEGIQIYPQHTNSSQKKERFAADVFRYQGANNLWDVLRSEFSLPHYENHAAVQDNIDWFIDNQAFLKRTTSRATPYLFFIHQQVKKRNLPIELVLVPIIESGYNPFNLSSAGAAGIWQMMPETASGFGVKQDWWYDGRRDIVASTRAALDYLSYLFNFFDGNPLLALAAYNSGEGSVMSAIRRNIRKGKSADFWSLPLPKETRTYVPRLLALATIISHPENYDVQLPSVPNAPYLAQVDVGGQIGLKQAARYAGMSLKKFQHLNPGYNRLVTHPHGPYKLVLPIENVEQFMLRLSRTSLSNHIDWIQYKVKSRDTLTSIAKRFKTTSNALREINHLKKTSIKRGMRLVIPQTITKVAHQTSKHSKNLKTKTLSKQIASQLASAKLITTDKSAQNRMLYMANSMKPGDTLYVVRLHDSIEKIADRFKLSPKALYATNKLHLNSIIYPGDRLLIPTHLVSTKKSEQLRKILPGDTLYMIRQGDTLEKIAKKFKTSAAAIRVANLMTDNRLQAGEHIIVPTHLFKPAPENSTPLKISA